MYRRPLPKLSSFLFRLYARQLLGAYPHYQPVLYRGRAAGGSDRACADRWEAMKRGLDAFSVESLLDLGSAEGFYVLRAAQELACMALGVDADMRRLAIAQNQIVSEKIAPAGFLFGVIDEALLKKLPVFDAVLCLSFLHHVMASSGTAYAAELLRLMRARAAKVFFFEMGQSDEKEQRWATELPDMGANPHQWIRDLLESAGFTRVVKIGESRAYGGSVKRALFQAEP